MKMVLKDKRKKKKNIVKYTNKKNFSKFPTREENDKRGNANHRSELYDESDLPCYDNNDDILIRDKDFLSYILKSDDELSEKVTLSKAQASNIGTRKGLQADFLLAAVAFSIPPGMV
ncbi:conserved Plasmodium protein, unknown function [Plasmodium knowlesi strain H]|uniref:Uncharacterized protein n=3 Tax=Plasmodium knowlesi TaxID=5850 RepID=A0A5K1U647_PLAKH|nr:conserved Plasmodium protein, unknown function [Plasmodium knowlesi strain H]OTN65985.1 Uncharacterized protein PKNOH_S100034100 [Plasmodium knowlesi]CAA9987706.1 conserved Plasmodium protein, unknown function [Plasmodium knowlesi strain H]SBO26927.1 conserved Plasmodium protein, unknown function [Plasmodium knowlesi strain H]SBO29616.1 conserved Plasmodium protein, unknown function [Plasmodium knowlesi strain H]VVS77180.1 conserved Plasmodium protein, unknown function [Plasmodium knowlesi |eukprot:XP_002258704.1 hypothetical protein, conserved in Plasmodium species [Plasmodium knowlesi strain H]